MMDSFLWEYKESKKIMNISLTPKKNFKNKLSLH